jgi:hypothetical protein
VVMRNFNRIIFPFVLALLPVACNAQVTATNRDSTYTKAIIIKVDREDTTRVVYNQTELRFTGYIQNEIFQIICKGKVLFEATIDAVNNSAGFAKERALLNYDEIGSSKIIIYNLTKNQYSWFYFDQDYGNIIFFRRNDNDWELIYDNSFIRLR